MFGETGFRIQGQESRCSVNFTFGSNIVFNMHGRPIFFVKVDLQMNATQLGHFALETNGVRMADNVSLEVGV